MLSRVTVKVLQYKLGDSLDKIRLPGNPRVLITRKEGVVCIKFNRPQFLNSLDSSLINPTVATLRYRRLRPPEEKCILSIPVKLFKAKIPIC